LLNGAEKVFDLTRGILNSTNFLFGQNRTKCQFAAEAALTSMKNSKTLVADNRTLFGMLNALNYLFEVPVHLNNSV